MQMPELKILLYRHELEKIGFNDMEYRAVSGQIKIQGNNNRMPLINNEGDISYGYEYGSLVAEKIVPLVSRVNEMFAAWENSRPMPFENLSQYRILSEFGTAVFAACDDTKTGRGLSFGVWTYSDESVKNGHYTDDYSDAKEHFALRSGLVAREKVITKEQAVDIKKAVDFSLDNCQSLSYAKKFTDINTQLSRVYPEIYAPKAKPPKVAKKNQTLEEKLNTAKKATQQTNTQNSTKKSKKNGERE
jgi:hypothetical protein